MSEEEKYIDIPRFTYLEDRLVKVPWSYVETMTMSEYENMVTYYVQTRMDDYLYAKSL